MVDVNAVMRDNIGIVYSLLASFELLDDQDAESLAYEALHKAVITYKESKKTKLSTYAYCVVSNAIRTHLRTKNKKRQVQYTSYHAPVSNDDDCEVYLVDTLHNNLSADSGLYTEEFLKTLRRALINVYNEIPTVEQKKIFIKWVDANFAVKQTDLASELGISQAAISRAISSFRYKLKQELEEYL